MTPLRPIHSTFFFINRCTFCTGASGIQYIWEVCEEGSRAGEVTTTRQQSHLYIRHSGSIKLLLGPLTVPITRYATGRSGGVHSFSRSAALGQHQTCTDIHASHDLLGLSSTSTSNSQTPPCSCGVTDNMVHHPLPPPSLRGIHYRSPRQLSGKQGDLRWL